MQKKRELKRALGDHGDVVYMWKGRKRQDRCYALVAGAVERIPEDIIVDKQPVLVEDDDDLEEPD